MAEAPSELAERALSYADGDAQVTGRDVGHGRTYVGAGLGGGHACCSWVVLGVPISSERKPQLRM